MSGRAYMVDATDDLLAALRYQGRDLYRLALAVERLRQIPQPRLVRMKDAAAMLGVHPDTVTRLVRDGHLDTALLPGAKNGPQGRRVTVESIDRFCAAAVTPHQSADDPPELRVVS